MAAATIPRVCVFAVGLVVLCIPAHANSRMNGAFLVLGRQLSGDLVEGKNITVTYDIHNVGQADAVSVQLRDSNFPQSRFAIHAGDLRKSWSRVNAGESRRMEVVVEPMRSGELLVSPAQLTYKDGDELRTTRLASEDLLVVEDILSYRRRTDKHLVTWIIFFVVSCVAVGFPYALYSATMASLTLPAGAGKKRSS